MTENNSINIEEIKKNKEIGNNFLKESKFSEAEKIYRKIIEKINEMPDDKANDKEIIEQKKFILSNLAMCLSKQNKIKESMECDKIIIKKLDKTFAKSYARLINNNLQLGKFNMARYHYDLMKINVDKEMMDKFPEVIPKIQKEIEKHDEMANGLLQLRDVLKHK